MQDLESSNDSDVVVSEPIQLVGLWIHDPDNPSQTSSNFLFGKDSRSLNKAVSSEYLEFAGREFGFTEFGEQSDHVFNVSVKIPEGPDYNEQRALLERLVLNRKTMCFRDNRSAVMFGTVSDLEEGYESYGSSLGFEVTRVHRETFEVD